jgi:hypothetical protein
MGLREALDREADRLQRHLGRQLGESATAFAWLNTALFDDGAGGGHTAGAGRGGAGSICSIARPPTGRRPWPTRGR